MKKTSVSLVVACGMLASFIVIAQSVQLQPPGQWPGPNQIQAADGTWRDIDPFGGVGPNQIQAGDGTWRPLTAGEPLLPLLSVASLVLQTTNSTNTMTYEVYYITTPWGGYTTNYVQGTWNTNALCYDVSKTNTLYYFDFGYTNNTQLHFTLTYSGTNYLVNPPASFACVTNDQPGDYVTGVFGTCSYSISTNPPLTVTWSPTLLFGALPPPPPQ